MLLRAFAFFLLVSTSAYAQDPGVPPPVDDAPVVDTAAGADDVQALPEAVQTAADTWIERWRTTPRLVSLKSQDDDAVELREQLRARMRLLGEKTFSNREWKSYWERQVVSAGEVAKALRGAGLPDDGFVAWVELANAKVKNQDVYFSAIESERDAVDERLEATLDVRAPEDREEDLTADPNPYERRRLHLDNLDRRIEVQNIKRRQGESEVKYIELVLHSETIVEEAIRNDLGLAEKELSIAVNHADLSTGLGALWGEVADKSATKVEKIRLETEYGESRQRSRQVELGLAQSQVEFRKGRVVDLEAQVASDGGIGSLAIATWETVLQWLQTRAPWIVFSLVLVVIGSRFALKAVGRLSKLILDRTDDDPNVDDDSDQRRATLADVFTSVARIGIYIVAALIALDQIGVNTGPILGSVAILGLAISFGSQNLVRDVVNGFFILLENQYAVGDVVDINGVSGGVERISIRSTWVRSSNGDLHVLPNGSIAKVSNLTRGWSRSVVEVGVSYDADLALVEKIVGEVGEVIYADPEWTPMLDAAPTWVGVTALGDSAVTVRMMVKVEAGAQWAVSRELNRRVKLAFDAAGIGIPYPQMVVHRG